MKRACDYSRAVKRTRSQPIVDHDGTRSSPGLRQESANPATLAHNCPDCGQTLWHQEGCVLCPVCGYSQC